MAITITPELTNLGRVTAGTQFTHIFNASSTEGAIVLMTITPSIVSDTVTITDRSVSGAYMTRVEFPHTSVTYVDAAKSDKTQTPVNILSDLDSVPKAKELVKVIPDPIQSVTVTYTVTATDVVGDTAEKIYSFVVLQNYSVLRDWIKDYMGKAD